jgi:hypothetical protein
VLGINFLGRRKVWFNLEEHSAVYNCQIDGLIFEKIAELMSKRADDKFNYLLAFVRQGQSRLKICSPN